MMSRKMRGAIVFLIVIGVAALIALTIRSSCHRAKASELGETIRSAQPIIEAIRKFQSVHNRPPRSLQELAPKFIDRIGSPAGPAHGHWEYWVDSPGGQWHTVRRDPKAGEWAIGIAVRKDFWPKAFYNLGDYFVYHPSGQYSTSAYGGVLQKIDGWGYYHE